MDERGQTAAHFPFAGRILRVVFHLQADQEPGRLIPSRIEWNDQQLPTTPLEGGLLINRNEILALPSQGTQQLDVFFMTSESSQIPDRNG